MRKLNKISKDFFLSIDKIAIANDIYEYFSKMEIKLKYVELIYHWNNIINIYSFIYFSFLS